MIHHKNWSKGHIHILSDANRDVLKREFFLCCRVESGRSYIETNDYDYEYRQNAMRQGNEGN